MFNKLLTFVAFIDNEEKLEQYVQSVFNQPINLSKTEFIFVDSVCSEKTKEYVNGLGLKNISFKYFKKPNITEAEAYNFAKEYVNSNYVNFSRTSAYFKKNSVKNSLFKGKKLISFKPKFFNSNAKETVYKASPLKKFKGKINLIKTPYGFQLNLSAFFIPFNLLSSVDFDLSLKQDSLYKFVIDILALAETYYYKSDLVYYYTHALEDIVGVAEIQFDKEWYTESIENFATQTFLRYKNFEFVKYALFYLVLAKYNCNLFNRNKNVLNAAEVEKFDSAVGKFLSYYPLNNNFFFETANLTLKPTRSLMVHLFKLKCAALGIVPKVCLKNGEFSYAVNLNGENSISIPIRTELEEKVILNVVNYSNGNLVIDGTFTAADFLNDSEFLLYAELNGKKYPLVRNNIYPDNFSFGVSFYKKYRFNISLPCTEKQNIKFYFEYNNKKIPLKIRSTGPFCRISCKRNSYWHFGENTLYFKSTKQNGDILKIRRNNILLNFYNEIYVIFANVIRKKFTKKSIIASGFRVVYWLTRPFFAKKRIWLYFDKLYKAGDNADYLFRFAFKQNDGINNYYIINKDSPDYKKLKSEYGKNIIVFNSIKSKLYALNAECALATHCNVMGFSGFPRKVHPFFTNLYKLKVVCVQHGLTIQQIAVHQNRLVDNTELYCCASKFEIDNLNQEIYGYYSNELKLVGLARYDGLKDNDQKQILITPTWRKECARGDSQMGSARKYNELFKTTEYFRLYNTLINDKKLIETAKKYNYKIVYLLHPVVSSQIEDFTVNDYVEILAASGDISYEKILTESSLMVTDYSGVQFDFAYQRKPIVYYHPSTLPPHYEEGCGFMYDTMGFGPIVTEHNELVNELCYYMKSSCKMKQEYINRADNFFAFDDFNNCKRIYGEVIKFLNK